MMTFIMMFCLFIPTLAFGQTTASQVDLSHMFMNTQSSAIGVIKLVKALAFTVGVGLAGAAMWGIRKLGGRQGEGSPKKLFWMFMIGVLMVNFSSSVSLFTNTLSLGNQEANFMSSVPTGNTDPAVLMKGLMGAVFLIIQVIGTITFFRGLWQMKKWGDSGGQGVDIWQPIGLILFGSFAINIRHTIQMFADTTGISLPTFLT